MTKDEAFKIIFDGKDYYVNSYSKENNESRLTQIYGPFTKIEAGNFKTMDHDRRKRYKKRLLINSIKNMPCVDCGKVKNLTEMTFDHVRGKKSFNIANGCKKSWDELLRELKICDLVCRSCHNVREYLRGIFNSLVEVEDLAELLFRVI